MWSLNTNLTTAVLQQPTYMLIIQISNNQRIDRPSTCCPAHAHEHHQNFESPRWCFYKLELKNVIALQPAMFLPTQVELPAPEAGLTGTAEAAAVSPEAIYGEHLRMFL